MKTTKKAAVFLLLFAIILLSPIRALANEFLKTTTDLRLRAGPSTTAAILNVIPQGTEIEIYDTTGTWAKTSYSGTNGYSSLIYMAPTASTTMTMVTIDLRLRTGPSVNYGILAVIPRTTPVPVLGKSGSWIKTVWSGKVGWISGPYTKLLSELPKLTTTTTLNFRSGPSTAYSIIGKVPQGTRIPVLSASSSGNWIKTWYNARVGWLSKAYLTNSITGTRPSSPPDYILDYSNTKLAWSSSYPEDSAYAYPQLGGHYRYNDGLIHLTFDLGYENGLTEGFLDVLKSRNVKARFYVTGYYLRSEPELVRRMLAEGHQVGNHSDQHPDTVDLMASSLQRVYDDLRAWEEEYKRVTGGYPSKWYYRPPSGIFSQRVLGLTWWMGYQTELWQVALADWDPNNQLSEEYTMNHLMTNTQPGSIVLLHAVSSTNLKISGKYIDEIRAKGWQFAAP